MMTLLIVLLSFVLILDCLILSLLVLVQLPKKDAGVGMAFGGGAADALFGAGSGTALTKLTKYTTIIFFVIVLILSVIDGTRSSSSKLRQHSESPMVEPQPAPPASTPAATALPASSNSGPLLTIGTNAAPALTSPAANSTAAPAVTTKPPPPASATNNPPK